MSVGWIEGDGFSLLVSHWDQHKGGISHRLKLKVPPRVSTESEEQGDEDEDWDFWFGQEEGGDLARRKKRQATKTDDSSPEQRPSHFRSTT